MHKYARSLSVTVRCNFTMLTRVWNVILFSGSRKRIQTTTFRGGFLLVYNSFMQYISLFAGIGGFDLALNRLGHVCVWANEWDKYAAQIYNKNFEETPSQRDTRPRTDSTLSNGEPRTLRGSKPALGIDTRDIRTVPTSEIPDHDLLVGGVPCQSWSIAGKRGGFDDPRGNMWFECFRILRDKQPKYFILENVKGLLSHDGGKSMERICEELCECGYAIDFEVLNSKNFGVPQNRERVFIVGFRMDLLDECQVF